MSDVMTVKQIREKVNHLRGERANWETHWQDIADFIIPRKNTIITQRSPGEKRNIFLLDNSGVMANELLAGALHGLLTNPNAQWFELTTGDVQLDQQDGAREWLQGVTEDMHNVLNNSNFQTEVHELYVDLAGFGTSVMLSEEDDRSVVRFSTQFIRDYLLDENNLGFVDQIYREWKWSADKIVAEFGEDKVGEKVLKAYKAGKNDKFCIIHAVYPKNLVAGSEYKFDYISQYILPDEEVELRLGGFKEFPYTAPRWSKAPGETYGRSPGMNALPEVKTLNKMTETVLKSAQKVVDPPLQLPDDGFIMPIVTKPGGINYYRSGTQDVIKPIMNNAQIDFGYQAMQDKRQRIKEAYYVDQLQLREGPQMTATEVLQRTEEKMRLLGPMLGRMQSEFLRPLIDRVFAIMQRRGKIRPIPPILSKRLIDVRYSSMVAKSQRVADGQNILRTMEAAAPFINTDPTVLDNINGDEALKAIARIYGLPQSILRSNAEVAQIRKDKAAAQQAALEAQQQQMQVDNAAKMAPIMMPQQGG